VIRANVEPVTLTNAIRAAIRGLDPAQAIFNVKTMDQVVSDSLSGHHLYLWLAGLFAGAAMALSVAGIYGVVSYAVAARTQEFGIRVALGAAGSRVLGLVLRHGAALVGIGLAFGAAGAFAVTRFIKSVLVGVTPGDPATFVLAALLMAGAALAACLIPARRATRVDPIQALRYE